MIYEMERRVKGMLRVWKSFAKCITKFEPCEAYFTDNYWS